VKTTNHLNLIWIVVVGSFGAMAILLGNSSLADDFTNRVYEIPPGQSTVTFLTDSTNAEPTYENLPVSQWVQTKTKLNPHDLPLSKLLTLKQVSGLDDWGVVKFEVSVKFDTLTNSPLGGGVQLCILENTNGFLPGSYTGQERAKNGHVFVWWNVNYDAPGQHEVRAKLTYYNGVDSIEILGPPLFFNSSNVCQFSEDSAPFNSSGASIQAKLREQIGTYRIELKTTKGKHIKTISGTTTNGRIDLNWDLTDERGGKFKGDSFDGLFFISYPNDSRKNPPAKYRYFRVPD
jgi:hypothetical protein